MRYYFVDQIERKILELLLIELLEYCKTFSLIWRNEFYDRSYKKYHDEFIAEMRFSISCTAIRLTLYFCMNSRSVGSLSPGDTNYRDSCYTVYIWLLRRHLKCLIKISFNLFLLGFWRLFSARSKRYSSSYNHFTWAYSFFGYRRFYLSKFD